MRATGIFYIVALYSIGMQSLKASQAITCQGVHEACYVDLNKLHCDNSGTIMLQQNFYELWSDELQTYSSIPANVTLDGESGKCLFSSKLFKNQETMFDCYFQTVKNDLELNYQHISPHLCNCSCKIHHLKPKTDICSKGISPPVINTEIEREIEISFNLEEEKLHKCDFDLELYDVSGSSPDCNKLSETRDPQVDKILKHNRNQSSGKIISCKFENVSAPAHYCLLIFSHLPSDQCRKCKWITSVVYESKGNPVPAEKKSDASIQRLTVVVVSVLLSIFVVFILFGFYLRRRGASGSFIEPSNHNDIEIGKVHENFDSKALQELSVFIIYSDECEQHSATVHALAEFLKKNCKCKVSYDGLESDEVFADPFNWMKEKITTSDKVIVVNSEGAFYKVQNLRNKQPPSWDSPFSSVFLLYMAYLNDQPEFREDYSKFINIRFSYTDENYSLDAVAPNVVYEIPKYLDAFCCHIHGLNSDIISTYTREDYWTSLDDDSYQHLINTVKKTDKYLRKTPFCKLPPILDNYHTSENIS